MLRSTAQIAERPNKSRISEEDVAKGFEEVKEIKKKYNLEALSPHHRLIVEVAKENPGILSTNFYEVYQKEARERGLNPKSNRTFSNYVSELIELVFLKVERANIRGNVRSFSAE